MASSRRSYTIRRRARFAKLRTCTALLSIETWRGCSSPAACCSTTLEIRRASKRCLFFAWVCVLRLYIEATNILWARALRADRIEYIYIYIKLLCPFLLLSTPPSAAPVTLRGSFSPWPCAQTGASIRVLQRGRKIVPRSDQQATRGGLPRVQDRQEGLRGRRAALTSLYGGVQERKGAWMSSVILD